jgi:hypothetical protein
MIYTETVQGNRLTGLLFEDFFQLVSNGKTLRRGPVTNLASGFPEQKLAKGVAGFFFAPPTKTMSDPFGCENIADIYKRWIEETEQGKRCSCWMGHRGYRGDSVLERSFWHNLLKTEKVWHGSIDQLQIGQFRVDVAIDCDGKSVVVEMDGAAYHDADRDRRRDDILLNSVDAIIRIPYAPMEYFRFGAMYALTQWFSRFDVGDHNLTITADEFYKEMEEVRNDPEKSFDEWLDEVEPSYDVVSVTPSAALVTSPLGFLQSWNARPITIQYGQGKLEIIDRIYERSGCKRIDG